MDFYEKHKWKIYLALVVYIIIVLICWEVPYLMGWYDTLLGEQGLKNVIAIVRMSVVTGVLMGLPLMVMMIFLPQHCFLKKKQPVY